MLAPWFRGRAGAEDAPAGQPAPPSGPADLPGVVPTATPPAPAEPTVDASLAAPRPAFGQRVF